MADTTRPLHPLNEAQRNRQIRMKALTEVGKEMNRQDALGYDDAHDDTHGITHLWEQTSGYLGNVGATTTTGAMRKIFVQTAALATRAVALIDRSNHIAPVSAARESFGFTSLPLGLSELVFLGDLCDATCKRIERDRAQNPEADPQVNAYIYANSMRTMFREAQYGMERTRG